MVMLPRVGGPAGDIFAASGAAGNKAWLDLAPSGSAKIAPPSVTRQFRRLQNPVLMAQQAEAPQRR
jgi:hypothetical protein